MKQEPQNPKFQSLLIKTLQRLKTFNLLNGKNLLGIAACIGRTLFKCHRVFHVVVHQSKINPFFHYHPESL
ncbi:hypothetical protein GBA52_005653 [Prunus armeniaca]|nr:hypothetical protein GBA52_005653 [Prunus armeniaca]